MDELSRSFTAKDPLAVWTVIDQNGPTVRSALFSPTGKPGSTDCAEALAVMVEDGKGPSQVWR